MKAEMYVHLSSWSRPDEIPSNCGTNNGFNRSVLTRPEHIKEVFKDSDKHFKAVDNNSGYLMSQILGQCVGLVSGNQWRNIRSVTEKAFTRTASTGYVSLIQRRITSYFEELQGSKNLSEGLLDPAEDLKLLPFLVVAEVIYGKLSPELESKLREIAPRREALFKHVISGGLARFSFSKYLPTKANRALAEFRAEWHALNRMAYDLAIAADSDAPIISFYAAADAGEITHEQMYQTLDEMLYANLDVTLGGISWNVVFLAANRAAQASLLAEVAAKRQVDISDADEGEDQAVEKSSRTPKKFNTYLLSTSTFLAACILESARLRPLAAFSVPQSAPTPRLIDGYFIPAGTAFVVDSYALNIRNPYWGTDSNTYRPQRFVEPRPGMATEMRYNYWRFGFGPRQCLGKYVADLIIRMLLVKLVEGYELEMRDEDKDEDEEKVWQRDRETWINHPKMLVRCVRKGEKGE